MLFAGNIFISFSLISNRISTYDNNNDNVIRVLTKEINHRGRTNRLVFNCNFVRYKAINIRLEFKNSSKIARRCAQLEVEKLKYTAA